jgi:hypothetical protein
MRFVLLLACLLPVAACGGDSDTLECTGASCTCPAETSCDLSGTECEAESCSIDCSDHNECTGECGASCSVECGGGSTCDVTVGASGSVTCSEGATCHVTCTDSCSVSCSPDSTCDLLCPGEQEARPIEEGGSCD